MAKNPSSAQGRAAPASGRRNFRLSPLEILITVLIFVGVLYLLTMWATNMFTPGEEAAAPTAPPGAMVERALAASEKVLAEQISQSRDIGSLRKQVESLQAQARKTPGAGSVDPADAAQDRRLDEVNRRLDEINHKASQIPDLKPLLARLEKLEKDPAARPTATTAFIPAADPQVLARLEKLEKDLATRLATQAALNPATAALVQQENRLQRLETGLQEARKGLSHPRPAPPDPQLLERLEKALAQGMPASPAPVKAAAPAQPEAKPAAAPPLRAETRPAVKPAPRAESDSRRVSHKVRPGETLGGVARRYRVSETDIVRWNQMGSRRLLLKGETLVIYPGQNS